MIPVDQREIMDPARADGLSPAGRPGDCLLCCVATIAEVPYEQVPHFAEIPDWWAAFRAWSVEHLGADVGTLVPVEGRVAQFLGCDPADVVAIACGPSPRRAGIRHAVVVDGNLRLLHDPHPSRAGLPRVDELYLFVPIGKQASPAPAIT